jgi:nucleoside-diphosphate-sugar epimerase
VAAHLTTPAVAPGSAVEIDPAAPRVAVTGGTGFLGAEVVRQLTAAGTPVLVLARREPPEWERVAGADYLAVDLSKSPPPGTFDDVEVVIHCAAATSGGWEEHQAHSIDATEKLIRSAAAAGVKKVIHVSSLAVLDEAAGRGPIDETTPLEPDPRSRGPYVWGKTESERLVRTLADEVGIALKILRPGAIVDYRNFDPPGRLGKRVGNLFVAVGSPRERLGVVAIDEAAKLLAWSALNFGKAPEVLNLLSPDLPTRRELVDRLKKLNPDLRVVWFPRTVLHAGSSAAVGIQKLVRRGKPPIDLARVFASHPYDTQRVTDTMQVVDRHLVGPAFHRVTIDNGPERHSVHS